MVCAARRTESITHSRRGLLQGPIGMQLGGFRFIRWLPVGDLVNYFGVGRANADSADVQKQGEKKPEKQKPENLTFDF